MAPEVVTELENYIRSIALNARIITTEYGQVPLPLILDVGVDRSNIALKSSKSSHEHSHHLENDGFVAVSFESSSLMILPKFQDFLDRLPSEIYRAKGILKFQGSQLHHVLQMSGKRYEIKSVGAESSIASRSPPPNTNQLVFIGRNLNAEAIRTQLTKCLAI